MTVTLLKSCLRYVGAMSFEPPANSFQPSGAATLKEARSDWLDEFAGLEAEIQTCAVKLGANKLTSGAPLKQRLQSLKDVPPGPNLSKERRAELHALLQECEDLRPLRAKIVHSRMVVEDHGIGSVALFQNASDAGVENPPFAAMSQWDFDASTARLSKLAEAFAKIRLNPSSPPRPKTASAACP